jgi:hypothetical protein
MGTGGEGRGACIERLYRTPATDRLIACSPMSRIRVPYPTGAKRDDGIRIVRPGIIRAHRQRVTIPPPLGKAINARHDKRGSHRASACRGQGTSPQ